MTYEPKPNTGSLFKNERKTSDSHPGATGTALIDGVEYYVDSWTNEIQSGDKAGQKYQSLKFKRKDGAGQGKPKASAPPKAAAQDLDDDCPF